MNYITTEWSLLWILGCLTLSFVMSYLLYKKEVFKGSKSITRLLFALRFIVVFTLAFFLLRPYINQVKVLNEQPIIIIGVDNSSSLVNHSDSSYYTGEFIREINNIKQEFEKNFQVELYSFGERIHRNPSFNFSDKKTDLSDYFNEISDVYSNRNVVANIIASDGIFNSGSNPVYANYPFNAPLYTLILGDTSLQKDLELTNVSYNDLAYLDNSFPIKASVLAQFSKGETIEVSLWEDELLLDKKESLVKKNDDLLSFDFKVTAQSVGVHNYRLEVTPISEEQNTSNNTQNIFVDILETKQKILLLSSISHPDINAISSAIQSNKNYELILEKTDNFDGNYSPYSLVIAYQTDVNQVNLPVFYFLGSKSKNLSLDWFSFSSSKSSLSEVNAEYNSFSLFSLDDKWENWINELPLLYSPIADYSFKSEYNNLFTQKVIGISTSKPIISFSKQNGKREAVCAAEGLWKWRLFEYLKTNDHKLFNQLINKSVQFLAVREDKRPFRLRHDKLVNENENFFIEADLYNANYELVNTSEVNIRLINEKGNEFNYTFNKAASNYYLELSQLMVGNYSFEASVLFNGKEYFNRGKFSIVPLELEQMHTRAKPENLYVLSKKHGGKTFDTSQFYALKNELNEIEPQSLSYNKESQNDLINLKWIFIILFVFLTIEWFIRKRVTKI